MVHQISTEKGDLSGSPGHTWLCFGFMLKGQMMMKVIAMEKVSMFYRPLDKTTVRTIYK